MKSDEHTIQLPKIQQENKTNKETKSDCKHMALTFSSITKYWDYLREIYGRDYADAIYGCSLSFIVAMYGICLLNLLESNESKKIIGSLHYQMELLVKINSRPKVLLGNQGRKNKNRGRVRKGDVPSFTAICGKLKHTLISTRKRVPITR